MIESYDGNIAKGAGMTAYRVLIGSVILQPPDVLEKFFSSLQAISLGGASAVFRLIDENQVQDTQNYNSDKADNRISLMKNTIIDEAVSNGFDYLFLIDSDILAPPGLIPHLIGYKKDIINEAVYTLSLPDNEKAFGSCTMISVSALRNKLNYSPEDFLLISDKPADGMGGWLYKRASELGVEVFTDDTLPAERIVTLVP